MKVTYLHFNMTKYQIVFKRLAVLLPVGSFVFPNYNLVCQKEKLRSTVIKAIGYWQHKARGCIWYFVDCPQPQCTPASKSYIDCSDMSTWAIMNYDLWDLSTSRSNFSEVILKKTIFWCMICISVLSGWIVMWYWGPPGLASDFYSPCRDDDPPDFFLLTFGTF